MAKNTRKVVKSESELQKLIEDTRKLCHAVKPSYNPTAYLILNGMEIANYQRSGFPSFEDIKKVLEKCIPTYKPVSVVTDSSLRYLLSEEETIEYEKALTEGILVKNVRIPIVEVATYEDSIITLLKLAMDNNAKILTNEKILEKYAIIKQQKAPSSFNGKQFQVSYTITSGEITIFE